MVYQRLSCLTVGHNLPLIFGSIFIKGWVLAWFVVQLTTHRQMGRQSELMLFLKICLELVCYRLRVHGNHGYLWQSSLTTTVTKKVSRWLHLKHCMAGNVGHHWIGLSLEREGFTELILLTRPRKRSRLSNKTWKRHSHARRATLIRGGDLLHLK